MIPAASGLQRALGFLAPLFLVALVAGFGWWLASMHYSAEMRAIEQAAVAAWERREAELTAQHAAQVEEYRQREQQMANDLRKVADDGQAAIDLAREHAAAADRVSDGLRAQARRLALACGSAAGSSSTPGAGQATAGPGLVLADVFGRADATAGELAAAYDRARAAGIACERAYGAVRGAK